jgi:CubicO group peptidase (beta-lactamase class C family)
MNIPSLWRKSCGYSLLLALLGFLSQGAIPDAIAQTAIDPTAAVAGIDADVERAMRTLHVPGVAVGVIVDGKVVLAQGYGLRDIHGEARVDANTLFDIASMTKSFTTTAMAILVDQGKLDWDRPVRQYLPWFQMYDPVATQLMTPRDLVTHRSGLSTHDFIRFSTYLTRDELVRRIRYLEPNHTFRDTYQYNNLMYAAAGYLAGEIAGTTWEELVNKTVFVPLGMTRSNTSAVEIQKSDDFARPHLLKDGEVDLIPFYEYQPFGVGPNGAVNSSVNDMLKYLAFHLADGNVAGRQLVSLAQMRELHSPVTVTPGGAYALGWAIGYYHCHAILWHSGSINGFTSRMVLLPKEKIGIVALNNLDRSRLPEILVNDLMDRLLGLERVDHLAQTVDALAKQDASVQTRNATMEGGRIPGTRPTLDLSAYAGAYFHPAYGRIDVERRGDELAVKFDAVTVPLRHYHYDTFELDLAEVLGMDGMDGTHLLAQFRLNTSGKVGELLLPLEPAVRPFLFLKEDK